MMRGGIQVLTRKAASEKVMILGIDGMDPRLTKKFISQ